jgi:hypothetical protein
LSEAPGLVFLSVIPAGNLLSWVPVTISIDGDFHESSKKQDGQAEA